MEIVLPTYNMLPYFSLKNLGKKVHTTHDKIRCLHIELQVDLCPFPGACCRQTVAVSQRSNLSFAFQLCFYLS